MANKKIPRDYATLKNKMAEIGTNMDILDQLHALSLGIKRQDWEYVEQKLALLQRSTNAIKNDVRVIASREGWYRR